MQIRRRRQIPQRSFQGFVPHPVLDGSYVESPPKHAGSIVGPERLYIEFFSVPSFKLLKRLLLMKINLAFVNDLDIVAVRIEHPRCVIARIVFGPRLRRLLALPSGVHGGFVERVYLSPVFRCKSNMHRLGIGLSFFEPKNSSFAVTKTLQIGMSVLAFVIYEVCDPKWLQGLGVKSD